MLTGEFHLFSQPKLNRCPVLGSGKRGANVALWIIPCMPVGRGRRRAGGGGAGSRSYRGTVRVDVSGARFEAGTGGSVS